MTAGRLLDAVVGVSGKPCGLRGLEVLAPVPHVVGEVGVVPRMHPTAFGGRLQDDCEVGGAFVDAHLQERASVVGVGRFHGDVVDQGVVVDNVNGVQHQRSIRGVVHGAGADHRTHTLGEHEAGTERLARLAPEGQVLTPSVGVGGQRVELNPREDGVADAGKSVVDVEIAVAVVAVGADEHHAILRQGVDELVAQCSAVGRAPLGQPPAVVDDQTLAIGLRHTSHPLKRVKGGSLVDHQRGEEQLCRRCHSGQSHTGTTPGCDASHVRAMRGVAVHVGGVAAHGLDVFENIRFRAVPISVRGRAGLAVLVPHRADARGGHRRVVKHGVSVVEAPVQHADEHAFTMKGLGQIESGMDAVHTRAVARLVDVGDRAGGQLHDGHGQIRNHVQGVRVDPEGRNARSARTCFHSRLVCGPVTPGSFGNILTQAPNESHGSTAVDEGHGMTLRHIHERLGRGVGGRELDQFAEGESVRGRQGLGLRRKKCTAQGGQEEDT